ncbi:hypothetical protein M408DRAFT_122887 [Serendipita vermifera MAFF 305830]|uniref:Uncharacterized protein n=1 Tax=Serendipita vermifera MAFF 305830 TaxID=933852 RepID=A0A0C2W2W0_SERVB|nr:hypothetical protein M408DRAFT_122887 [Serendipita vermifera MAFF 305830]
MRTCRFNQQLSLHLESWLDKRNLLTQFVLLFLASLNASGMRIRRFDWKLSPHLESWPNEWSFMIQSAPLFHRLPRALGMSVFPFDLKLSLHLESWPNKPTSTKLFVPLFHQSPRLSMNTSTTSGCSCFLARSVIIARVPMFDVAFGKTVNQVIS